MSWTRLDDGFDSHPKVLGLGTGTTGNARRYVWVRILIYTNRTESGNVPANIGAFITEATPRFLRDCLELGLLDDEGGQLVVHDWPLYADVSIAVKVAHVLARFPDASSNEIVKKCASNRNVVLAEINRQRGTEEPLTAVPEVVSRYQETTQEGGIRVPAPVPSRFEGEAQGLKPSQTFQIPSAAVSGAVS